MPYSEAANAKAKVDLANALAALDNHLSSRTYLVGNAVTLADIVIVSTLVYPFKFVCDPAYRSKYVNVMRWFDTCVNQPQFEAVIGKVVLATVEHGVNAGAALPAPAPAAKKDAAGKGDKKEKPAWDGVKKEKAPKAPKEPKPPAPPAKPKEEKKPKNDEEEEDEAPKEKKDDHLFKLMDTSNPTPFVMDAWKRCYSNCGGDYPGALKTFWETFDAAGWSIWRGDYQYNDELKVLFMTSNLIGGFIQRTDEIRKWLFGTMSIRGDESKPAFKISCYYLIRGQDIQPLIACNDDASCYNWTKIDHTSEADRAAVLKHWSVDIDEELEGEKCLDARCYK